MSAITSPEILRARARIQQEWDALDAWARTESLDTIDALMAEFDATDPAGTLRKFADAPNGAMFVTHLAMLGLMDVVQRYMEQREESAH